MPIAHLIYEIRFVCEPLPADQKTHQTLHNMVGTYTRIYGISTDLICVIYYQFALPSENRMASTLSGVQRCVCVCVDNCLMPSASQAKYLWNVW